MCICNLSIYLSIYLSIDCPPRRPNHSLTDSSLQLRNIFDTFFDTFFDQKSVLGLLGVPSSRPGRSWEAPWGTFGPSWAVLGGSGGSPGAPWGDPKSIKNAIRNLIRKQAESRRKKMAQTLRLSMFQSLTKPAAKQIQPDSKSIDTAFEVISSYIYIYLFISIYIYICICLTGELY